AGGVAFAAVAEVADEVGTTVPLVALLGIRLEAAGLEVAGFPCTRGGPRRHQKRQLVLPILLFHRLKAEQVRLHRQQVLSCDARVGGEGKGRKIMFSLRIDTVPERLHERFVRPVADTGLWVRSNVRYE